MKHLPLLLLLTFIIGCVLQVCQPLKAFINKTALVLGLKPVLNTYPILSLLKYRHKRQNVKQPIIHRILKTITQRLTHG